MFQGLRSYIRVGVAALSLACAFLAPDLLAAVRDGASAPIASHADGLFGKRLDEGAQVDAPNTHGNAASAFGLDSFPGDTEVSTPDGLKRIDTLRPGDKVLAYAEWKGETQVEQVTDLILSHHEQTIVTITLANGRKIEATGGHPLHTPTGWRAAQLLRAGGQLDIKGPDGKLATVEIAKVELRQETVPVYNLEVSNAHTFFVGKDGALVHNAHGNSRSASGAQIVYTIRGPCGKIKKTWCSGREGPTSAAQEPAEIWRHLYQ